MSNANPLALDALVAIQAVLQEHHQPDSSLSKHDALARITHIVGSAPISIHGDDVSNQSTPSGE